MSNTVYLTKSWEIGDGDAIGLDVEDDYIIVGKTDGRYWGISGTCTHQNRKMEKIQLENQCVRCPFHGALFDSLTGVKVSGPAGTTDIETYQILMSGGSIFLETEQTQNDGEPILQVV